jgi:hypothetical protein
LAELQRAVPGFRPPEVGRGAQIELAMPRGSGRAGLGDRVLIVTAKDFRHTRMIALTPKSRHLTLTVIGRDRRFAWDRRRMLAIFNLLRSREGFEWEDDPPQARCSCEPVFPIRPAGQPFADGMVVVGDASGLSRFLKNGIESALETARLAAEAAVFAGIDAQLLRRAYYLRALAIHRDNAYGRLTDRVYRTVQQRAILERSLFNLAAREPEHGGPLSAPIRWSLWNLFSGAAPYRDICRRFLSPATQFDLALTSARLALRRSRSC